MGNTLSLMTTLEPSSMQERTVTAMPPQDLTLLLFLTVECRLLHTRWLMPTVDTLPMSATLVNPPTLLLLLTRLLPLLPTRLLLLLLTRLLLLLPIRLPLLLLIRLLLFLPTMLLR